MTTKNWHNFHKIANFDVLIVWAACKHSIASLCNISALPVSLSLRYGFGYEKKIPKNNKVQILNFRHFVTNQNFDIPTRRASSWDPGAFL